MPTELLDLTDAAERLGVTVTTLRRWRLSPEPPDFFVRIGGRWKVSAARLEHYLNG